MVLCTFLFGGMAMVLISTGTLFRAPQNPESGELVEIIVPLYMSIGT